MVVVVTMVVVIVPSHFIYAVQDEASNVTFQGGKVRDRVFTITINNDISCRKEVTPSSHP
jgi:hypothetical protein